MSVVDKGTRASSTGTFPMPRSCPFSPPREYEELRETAPLVRMRLPNGNPVWVVTRHAEAQQVLTETRISTDPTRPGFPRLSPEPAASEDQQATAFGEGHFIDMDPPKHDVYRRMLISEFSVRRINALRPGIQRTADRLIDDMLESGPPADLVEAFGLPLPSLVICQLPGVPYDDHEHFQSRTRQLTRMVEDPQASMAAITDLHAYLDELVTSAEREPGDNLIGRLVTGQVASGALSHDALVDIAFLLLVAGHETTANMIPMGVLTLLEHPEQLAELRADGGLLPSAVEELLRYQSVVDWAAFDRMAVEDLELGGQQVRAGEGVYVLGASANRDDRVFEDPDTLDIHRGARNHVAFGYGVHQCLGQNLARAELEIAFETLFRRLPGLRVATSVEELPFKTKAPIFGLHKLPVTW